MALRFSKSCKDVNHLMLARRRCIRRTFAVTVQYRQTSPAEHRRAQSSPSGRRSGSPVSPTDGIRSRVNEGVVGASSILARVEFARPALTAAVDLKPVFAYEQVFRYVDPTGIERWLQLADAVNRICPDVVDAVGLVLSAHERDMTNDLGHTVDTATVAWPLTYQSRSAARPRTTYQSDRHQPVGGGKTSWTPATRSANSP
jgi:hypothetical protein